MLFRRLAGALTAAAIVMAPTMAVAQQAPAPAATYETGASQLSDDGDFPLIWIIGGIGLAVLLYFLLKGNDDDDAEVPTSP